MTRISFRHKNLGINTYSLWAAIIYLCKKLQTNNPRMKKLYSLFIALTIFAFTPALAQEQAAATPSAEELQAQITALQGQVESLEKRASTWDKIKKAVKISGYVQAGYEWSQDQNYFDEGIAAKAGASSFYIRRARVTLAGDLYNGKAGKADAKLQVDFAGTPKILDLHVRYSPVREFGAQIGQFFIPFSIESQMNSSVKLEFIQYALVIQRLALMGNDLSGLKVSGRQLGGQIFGGFFHKEGYDILEYNLGVFNGSAINAKDSDKGKDIVARLTTHPVKGLSIAGSYWWGQSKYSKSNVNKDYAHLVGKGTSHLNRYAASVAYDCPSFFVRAEYVGSKVHRLFSEGAYIAGGYNFLPNATVAARVDYFSENKYDDACELNYTLGVNYMPWKHLRLQLNYTACQYMNMGQKMRSGVNFMVTGVF